jgi:hypothetical protein
MTLRKPSIREIRQAERDLKNTVRAVLAGHKNELKRLSRNQRRQVEALVKEQIKAERERKRDIAALQKIFKSQGRSVKRPGRGLAKQLREYRPQIEARRAAEREKRATARQRRSIAARIELHAQKLDADYGTRQPGPGSLVENPGDFFRSLPREQQIEVLVTNDARA